jgi:hypothetical protein
MKMSTEGRPEIIGNCCSTRIGNGMYAYYAESGTGFDKVAETPGFYGSAVYVNGKYYACDYDYDSNYDLTYVRWYIYDAQTWHCEKMVENPLDFSYIATDRTYDSTDGKVYSIVYDKTGSAIWLATTSLTDGASTMIATLAKDVITIAASPTGTLYGIDTNANLYTISKSDASLTLIGSTAIYDDYESDYTQSITIDQSTGKLYWSEFHTEGLFTPVASIYEVNTATAATVKVADLPNNPEIVGTYVSGYIQAGVPAMVKNITATPASTGSLSYTFGFTAPTLTADGKKLDSNTALSCEVSVDGELLDIVEALPGKSVTSGPFTVNAGLRTLKISVENSKGAGETGAIMFFAGYDVPAAPTQIVLTSDGENAKLTWNASTTGAQGGAIRTPVSYTVTRMPDNKVVATGLTTREYSEAITSPASYSYQVSAVSTDGAGPAGESNSMVIGAFNVPYSCGFDSLDEFNLYTIVDVTSEGKVWNYDEDNRRMRHPWSLYSNIDDYAVTPGIRMSGSSSYQIEFDAYQMVASYPEHVELWFGTSQDIADMEMVLDTKQLPDAAKTFSAVVAPSADGICYFAFRANTGKNGFMSYVDNVKVTQKGASNVPAAVSDLVVKGAANGVEAVNISFKAPTTTMQGTTLSSLKRIEVKRGDSEEPVRTITDATPGAEYDITDSSVTTGVHTYTVVAYSETGAGIAASASAFAGVDVPGAPTDIKVSGEQGAKKISWKAPAEGLNGGNLEGVVSYRVCRVVNEVSTTLAEGLTKTDYTDTWTSDQQAFVYYSVTAITSAGESDAVSSDSYAVGEAYKLPYEESFAGGETTTAPWSVEQVAGLQGSWTIKTSGEDPYCSAQDSDKGLATFDGYHTWSKGCELRLVSPVIDISEFTDPSVTFYIYHWNGETWGGDYDSVEETLDLEISVEGKAFEKIPNATWELYRSKKGWQDYTVDLSDYARSSGIRLGFRGKSAGCFNIHIDNISLKGTKVYDGVESPAVDNLSICGEQGAIIYAGVEDSIKIYDTAGRLVASSYAAEGRIDTGKGVYVAVANGKGYKVIVK